MSVPVCAACSYPAWPIAEETVTTCRVDVSSRDTGARRTDIARCVPTGGRRIVSATRKRLQDSPCAPSDWSWAAGAMNNSSRRILRTSTDPCWGNRASFSIQQHDGIGSSEICSGLCRNDSFCENPIYVTGTKTCFLKLTCAKQVSPDAEMIKMGTLMPQPIANVTPLPPPYSPIVVTSHECRNHLGYRYHIRKWILTAFLLTRGSPRPSPETDD